MMNTLTTNDLLVVAGGAISEPSKPWEEGCFPQIEKVLK